jgi:tetratricopeptide (TPR) repeat protein
MTAASPMSGEPADLDALLARAIGEHRAGRLAEAAAVYRQLLALRPDLAEVHSNLGVVLKSQGKLDEAAAHYRQALVLKPDFAEACNNLGNVLRDQGNLDQAAAQYQQAVALRPSYADAHNNLGIILWRQNQFDQAAAHYRLALALNPNLAEAHNNLGNVLLGQGKLDEAAARYEQALTLRPSYADAHGNLAGVLLSQGRLDEAAARYEQALAFQPNRAEAHYNLGNALKQQGKLDEALARFQQALALRPHYPEAHNNLGNVLLRQGKFAEAMAHYGQALALRPDYAEAHNNLGNALKQQGKLDEALVRFEQALALRPDYSAALKNLAVTLRDQRKLPAACEAFQRLRALCPEEPDAELGLATCYLVAGDYERGWPAYEARLRMSDVGPRPRLPRWMGEPLAGRSLLVVAEQGLGDTIHFVRYARLLKEQGARIVLAGPAALGRLLAGHPDVDELFIQGSADEFPQADFYLPLLSAPGALGTMAATIPGDVPYLTADAALIEQWRRELAVIEGFKIGIAWQGSRDYSSDRQRSIPLAQFAPLARLPGVQLISLQKGFGSEQIGTVDFPVLDLSARLDVAAGPFMDTAAVIRSVDLVVTSDTAIAHLAGALGAPVWVALQSASDWRWQHDREDSPWYPTMRLFRQTRRGDWTGVFERVAQELARAAARPRAAGSGPA